MRSSGSTLASGVPPAAMNCAICRAISQFTGPWLTNSLARSPKIGMPSKGFPPNGPGSLTGAW